MAIIVGLKNRATHYSSGERALSYACIHMLRSKAVEDITDMVFKYTPTQTQVVLGAEGLAVTDLDDLPRWDNGTDDWGVYLNLSTRRVDTTRAQHASRAYASKVVEVDTRQQEMGVYVGSSHNRNGLRARIRQHLQQSAPGRQRAFKSAHYDFTGRVGVHLDFFAQTVLPQTVDRAYAPLIEGIFMVLLDVVDFSPPHHSYMTMAASDLLYNLRDGLQMPGLNKYGLNRVWSLTQGWLLLNPVFLRSICYNYGTEE
jgi:hypothetical protein